MVSMYCWIVFIRIKEIDMYWCIIIVEDVFDLLSLKKKLNLLICIIILIFIVGGLNK